MSNFLSYDQVGHFHLFNAKIGPAVSVVANSVEAGLEFSMGEATRVDPSTSFCEAVIIGVLVTLHAACGAAIGFVSLKIDDSRSQSHDAGKSIVSPIAKLNRPYAKASHSSVRLFVVSALRRHGSQFILRCTRYTLISLVFRESPRALNFASAATTKATLIIERVDEKCCVFFVAILVSCDA